MGLNVHALIVLCTVRIAPEVSDFKELYNYDCSPRRRLIVVENYRAKYPQLSPTLRRIITLA